MSQTDVTPMSRRALLNLIGTAAGGAAMYQAMASLGHAAESPYSGPIKLDGDPKGASVLILGAGLAGHGRGLRTAQGRLQGAGARISTARAGGRNWTLRGGDSYTELGGATQKCEFDRGHYINPGPWRIPYHHHAVLDYCKRLGVALEPFVQVNYNAYLHSTIGVRRQAAALPPSKADFQGGVAELLAKAIEAGQARRAGAEKDKEILLDGAAPVGRARRQLSLRRRPTDQRPARLRAAIPAAARRRAGAVRADRPSRHR